MNLLSCTCSTETYVVDWYWTLKVKVWLGDGFCGHGGWYAFEGELMDYYGYTVLDVVNKLFPCHLAWVTICAWSIWNINNWFCMA